MQNRGTDIQYIQIDYILNIDELKQTRANNNCNIRVMKKKLQAKLSKFGEK